MLEEVMMLGQGIEINLIDQEKRRGRVHLGRGCLANGLAKRRLVETKGDDQHHLSSRRAVPVAEKSFGKVFSRRGGGCALRSTRALHQLFWAIFGCSPPHQGGHSGCGETPKPGQPRSCIGR